MQITIERRHYQNTIGDNAVLPTTTTKILPSAKATLAEVHQDLLLMKPSIVVNGGWISQEICPQTYLA